MPVPRSGANGQAQGSVQESEQAPRPHALKRQAKRQQGLSKKMLRKKLQLLQELAKIEGEEESKDGKESEKAEEEEEEKEANEETEETEETEQKEQKEDEGNAEPKEKA